MNTQAIGQRIQLAREERQMTQRELAEVVGCTPQHISAIERGAKTPTLETFVDIATALQVPTDALLQDLLEDWWETWEKEIDHALAPLPPYMRTYIKKQIMDYYNMVKYCAQTNRHLHQR